MGNIFKDEKLAGGISAVATAVGSLFVVIGLFFTGCQIKSARDTVQATTLYTIEKDYNDIFSKRIDKGFLTCFGGTQSTNAGALPKLCDDPTARNTFFDILSFYRLLLDLESKDAIETAYVNARIGAFCEYLNSSAGKLLIAELDRKGTIRSDLNLRIKSQCG